MATLVKVMPKFDIFIIDSDYVSGLAVKSSLEKGLGEEVMVKAFPDAESCQVEMKAQEEKPAVIILEYTENKRLNQEKGEHMVDFIKKESPDSAIIMFSDTSDSERALQALAFGAQDFVIKDQFLHDHILSAVRKCLHPAKM